MSAFELQADLNIDTTNQHTAEDTFGRSNKSQFD